MWNYLGMLRSQGQKHVTRAASQLHMSKMYAPMYAIVYIASIHYYIPLYTATSISVCNVRIVL